MISQTEKSLNDLMKVSEQSDSDLDINRIEEVLQMTQMAKLNLELISNFSDLRAIQRNFE